MHAGTGRGGPSDIEPWYLPHANALGLPGGVMTQDEGATWLSYAITGGQANFRATSWAGALPLFVT